MSGKKASLYSFCDLSYHEESLPVLRPDIAFPIFSSNSLKISRYIPDKELGLQKLKAKLLKLEMESLEFRLTFVSE